MNEQPISPPEDETCEVCGRHSIRPICRECINDYNRAEQAEAY